MRTIYTLNDARKAKAQDEANRQHQRDVRNARAKVRRWEQKVRQYGGSIHRDTLKRMRAHLATLEA